MDFPEAMINSVAYCHPDRGEDCYTMEQTGEGTTAHQLIRMLQELPPNVKIFVQIGDRDWEESNDLDIAPPQKVNTTGYKQLSDDHYWITSKEEAKRWKST